MKVNEICEFQFVLVLGPAQVDNEGEGVKLCLG